MADWLYEATKDIYDFENGIHEKYKTDYEEPILMESIEKEKIDFENAHRYY